MTLDNKYGKLSGHSIIVTGSLGLLGSEFVNSISEEGGRPILIDIDETTSSRFLALPDHFKKDYFKVDITKQSEINAFFKDITDRQIKITGLVNNAAINPKVEVGQSMGGIESFEEVEWDKEVAVGLTGPILLSKYLGHYWSSNKSKGVIVNISSDLGIISPDQRIYDTSNENIQKKPVGYSVIKHGLIGLTKYTATYWPDYVRCNALCPGGVYVNQDDEFVDNLKKLIPLGRMASRNEYNEALVFLLSDASNYMTGQSLIIDGGRSVW